jgi:hypothetical protein
VPPETELPSRLDNSGKDGAEVEDDKERGPDVKADDEEYDRLIAAAAAMASNAERFSAGGAVDPSDEENDEEEEEEEEEEEGEEVVPPVRRPPSVPLPPLPTEAATISSGDGGASNDVTDLIEIDAELFTIFEAADVDIGRRRPTTDGASASTLTDAAAPPSSASSSAKDNMARFRLYVLASAVPLLPSLFPDDEEEEVDVDCRAAASFAFLSIAARS